MQVAVAWLIGALLAAFQTPSAARPAQWTEVTVGAFRVAGTGETARLIRAGRHVSELWRASHSIVPGIKAATTSPIAILSSGDPAIPRSAFLEGRGQSYVVIPPADDHLQPDIAALILRQFVHSAGPRVPLWIEVGLGEFLSTLELTPDGSQAILGEPIAAHLTMLRGGLLQMPLVLGATPESPVYTDASQRRRFIAQSWLLLHYLCANAARRPQLGAFVEALAGEAPEAAFHRIFGMDHESMGHALSDYLAEGRFPSYQIAADSPDLDPNARPRGLSPIESEALVADALVQAGKPRQALDRLRPLSSSADPHVHDAQAVSARALVAQGDRRGGLRLFAQSMEQTGFTDLRDYYYAATLLNITPSFDMTRVRDDDAQTAARLLTGVLARVPQHADALALLGIAELATQNVGGAIQRLTEAFRSYPRHEYALWLARAYAAGGDPADARQLLQPLAESGRPQAVRLASRQLLETLPAGDAPAQRTFAVYREPKPGEVKAAGVLTEVTCSPAWVVFHVTLPERELLVATARLDLVDFVSYRHDGAPNAGCGRRTPGDKVLITWLPDPTAPVGTEGFVSTVEFPASND